MVEQPQIAQQFQKAVDATKSYRRRSPLLYLLIFLLIAAAAYDGYLRYQEVPELRRKNDRLASAAAELKKNASQLAVAVQEKETQITRLKAEIAPFDVAARQRYPEAGEEALAKLHEDLDKQAAELIGLGEMTDQHKKDLKRLRQTATDQEKQILELKRQVTTLTQGREHREEEIQALRDRAEYGEVATWDTEGRMKLWNSRLVDTPVTGWSDTYRQEPDDGSTRWRCGSVALYHYREIMEQYPIFPFPYFVLAECLKQKGEPSWEEYAKKGIAILEKTTKIPNHVPDHDATLEALQKLLATP